MSSKKIPLLNQQGIKYLNDNFEGLDSRATSLENRSTALEALIKEKIVTLTNAEMLALRATPKTLIAAPGAGYVIEVIDAVMFFGYTGAYTESADNLAIRYNDGSGQTIMTIETTGFLTATADTLAIADRQLSPIAAKSATDNKAVVLHNNGDGEFGGGNAANVLTVKLLYRIVAAAW